MLNGFVMNGMVIALVALAVGVALWGIDGTEDQRSKGRLIR